MIVFAPRPLPRAVLLALLLLGGPLACPKDGPDKPPRPSSAAPAPGPSAASAPTASSTAGAPRAGTRPDAPAPHRWPKGAYRVPAGLADRGVFSDLDARVRLHHAPWLSRGPWTVLATPKARFLLVAGTPVGFAPSGLTPAVQAPAVGPGDADSDGIPDPLDLLIGAKKAALNRAAYTEGYVRIPYPGGDLPRDRGVCTDVVIRALRNAGIDLQKEVHLDIKGRPKAYPMVRRPNAHIDHRRVRTLLPYFRRHWQTLSPTDRRAQPLLPGDLVFMNTLGDGRPDHIGVISDRLGESGHPLVINNWTVGHRTAEMDLLGFVPLTHRFRLPWPGPPLPPAQRGLPGLLRRHGVTLPTAHRQVLLVTVPTWRSIRGELRRLVRVEGDEKPGWQEQGKPLPVVIGAAGLGLGHGLARPKGWVMPEKREGDRRSPAGVFALGTAFGRPRRPPYAPGSWPYRPTGPGDRFVDDPKSPHYNTWQRRRPGNTAAWASAEDLSAYGLGLVVKHNQDPARPGAGSAVFLHDAPDLDSPSIGCTMMRRKDLTALLRWLDPAKKPVLVQLAGAYL